MFAMFLQVTTGDEPLGARRRLYWTIGASAVCAIAIGLFFIRVSPGAAIIADGVAIAVWVVLVLLPVILGVNGARILQRHGRQRAEGEYRGVFYLISPTREWLRRRGVEVVRLNQFTAVTVSGDRIIFWSSYPVRVLYEYRTHHEFVYEIVAYGGYACLQISAQDMEPVVLMRWRELLGVHEPMDHDLATSR